ncbi:MAG: GNVR domain-containing protein, partial [Pseudomonadales bacterium]
MSDRATHFSRLRGLIDEMPEVEAEVARLNRDFDVTHAHYQSLLNSLEREQVSREVFQSERIDLHIIDPPAAGLEPVAPNRMILLLLVFTVGVGGAGAMAFVLSQIHPVFQVSADQFRTVGVPALGSVGRYFSSEERQCRNLEYASFA